MTFIITFGQIHTHRVNNYTFDKDSVAVVTSTNYAAARKFCSEVFSNQYHRCIEEEAFDKSDSIKFFPGGKHPAN